MKLITAIVREEKFADIRRTLEGYGVQGMTVSQASGYGRQKGHKQVYRGAKYSMDLVPKLRLEILVDDIDALRLPGIISEAATTGRPGDGKIWVTEVERVIRVSDQNVGESAIS